MNPLALWIGARLRQLRTDRRLRLAALAGIAGITPRELYRFEAGDRIPRIERLALLLPHLGVDFGTFFQPPPGWPVCRPPTIAGGDF